MKKKLVAMTLVLAMAGTTLAAVAAANHQTVKTDRLFQQKMQTKTLITLMEKMKPSIQTKQ